MVGEIMLSVPELSPINIGVNKLLDDLEDHKKRKNT